EKAEPYLNTIINLEIKSAEDVRWAKRILALVLALQGNYQKSRLALERLDVLDKDLVGAEGPDEIRARALVLATQRSRASRLQAIRLLKESAGRLPLAAEDQFLLSQLHESIGDWREARSQMLSLV